MTANGTTNCPPPRPMTGPPPRPKAPPPTDAEVVAAAIRDMGRMIAAAVDRHGERLAGALAGLEDVDRHGSTSADNLDGIRAALDSLVELLTRRVEGGE